MASVYKRINDTLISLGERFSNIHQRLDKLEQHHEEEKVVAEERHKTLENLMTSVQKLLKETTNFNTGDLCTNSDPQSSKSKGKEKEDEKPEPATKQQCHRNASGRLHILSSSDHKDNLSPGEKFVKSL